MAIMNLALLALVPAVLARPQVGHGDSHRAFHIRDTTGTGVPGAFSHSSYPRASGTAPFPVPGGNGTSGAATGSSAAPLNTGNGGPVYITSVINVIPTPITSDVTDSAGPTGVPAGSGGAGYSSGSGSQQTGGPGGPGPAGGSACGPATVTITQANTVTVTVNPSSGGAGGAGGAGGQSASNGGAGAQSQAPISSAPVLPPVSSAPFPIGNSSVPAGTGTGFGTGTAVSTTSSSSYSVAAVQQQSTSSSVPNVPTAQPYQPVVEKYRPHQENHPAPPPPPANSAPPVAPPPSSSSADYQAQAASSAPATSSSGASKPGSVGAKGVAYNTPAQATQIGGLAWACNWGQTVSLQGAAPFEYVPQLWGKKPGMTDSIASNVAAANAKACLFYNEPDKTLDVGGSQIGVGDAVKDFTTIMKPIQEKGTKVSTPCVANDGVDYMNSFVSAFPKNTIDIMCFHWYGNDVEQLKGVVATFQAIATQWGIKEMWINEWAVQPAPSDLSSYTEYLDGAVTRYAYNMNDIAGSTGY